MPVSGRVVAELKNSNGPSKPQEDFQTLKWLKILLEKGAWEGSCGTPIRGGMMEFMTGILEKETLELSALLDRGRIGQKVKVNGAIHAIRHMGDVAFVVLRKREGLLQCVYEENTSGFDLKDLKEAETVEAEGVLTEEERAVGGVELRLTGIRILSVPTAPLLLPIGKLMWIPIEIGRAHV